MDRNLIRRYRRTLAIAQDWGTINSPVGRYWAGIFRQRAQALSDQIGAMEQNFAAQRMALAQAA